MLDQNRPGVRWIGAVNHAQTCLLKICKNDPHKEFFLSKPWLFAADLFVDMSPRFVYFLVGKAREGAILNALKAPALLVLSIPTPWIKATNVNQVQTCFQFQE